MLPLVRPCTALIGECSKSHTGGGCTVGNSRCGITAVSAQLLSCPSGRDIHIHPQLRQKPGKRCSEIREWLGWTCLPFQAGGNAHTGGSLRESSSQTLIGHRHFQVRFALLPKTKTHVSLTQTWGGLTKYPLREAGGMKGEFIDLEMLFTALIA